MKLLLLLAALLAGQEAVRLPEFPDDCHGGAPRGIGKDGKPGKPCVSIPNFDREWGEKIDRIVFSDRAVPRLRYALELRDELRKMGRICDHAEDWERTVRAISEGATLLEMAVCHHEKKTRRTLYRVAARWLEERDYGSASVLEGVERRWRE